MKISLTKEEVEYSYDRLQGMFEDKQRRLREMNNLMCPACGGVNIQTERRLWGWYQCKDCEHSWQNLSNQQKQTVFDQITASPEVLAKEFVEKQEDKWDDKVFVLSEMLSSHPGRSCVEANKKEQSK